MHIADTLGELGLWYELTHVSFIGGSITKNGGHNPYEAILADTFIIHGPETFNFEEIYQKLDERNFGKKIINSEQLFQEVLNLFNKDKVAICFTKAKELIVSDKKKIKIMIKKLTIPNRFTFISYSVTTHLTLYFLFFNTSSSSPGS